MNNPARTIRVGRIDFDLGVEHLDDLNWLCADPVRIARFWSGDYAPRERHVEVRALWSDEAIHFRFECEQHEPLLVSSTPAIDAKTIGLWNRDVCEVFVAPDADRPEHYFEFEAAPTGEWIDLAINWKPTGRETDWEYKSGMSVAARVDPERVLIAMRIPWSAFGRRPEPDEQWRGNLFRCLGTNEATRYLAWQPTGTVEPNYHIPSAFGWIEFVD